MNVIDSPHRLLRRSGVEIVHISSPRAFMKHDAILRKKVLTECEQLQSRIWKPICSIENNTINNDGLVLMMHKKTVVGFLSYGVFKVRGQRVVHFNDIMVSREHQGEGLFKDAFASTVIYLGRCFGSFVGLVFTYNALIINTIYSRPHIYSSCSFPSTSLEQQYLLLECCSLLKCNKDVDVLNGVIYGMLNRPVLMEQHVLMSEKLGSLIHGDMIIDRGDCLALMFRYSKESEKYAEMCVNTNSSVLLTPIPVTGDDNYWK